MKKLLLSTITAAAFALGSNAFALIANDVAANYTSATWTNGANLGTGFGAWSLAAGGGTGGFGGRYITETANNNTPASAGITGMNAQSFALYADPLASGAFSTAERLFSTPLSAGDTFSFQWGINFDSGATNGTNGNKGMVLFAGATELINLNNSFNSDITFNGTNVNFGYGTAAMTWSFAYNGSAISVSANDRDGTGSFATNISVASAPTGFRFYASQMQAGDSAKPYFNNLGVVPEPSTYALLALSAAGLAGYAARRRARK